MDAPQQTPVPPWEQELAAEALAELKRGEVVDNTEQVALKVADSSLLIAEVDRMIADKRADLDRLKRLSGPAGPGVNAQGVTLAELGKPACIVFLLLVIVAAGLLLNWMAGQIATSLKERPLQQEQALTEETVEAEAEPAPESVPEDDDGIPMP
jgi:hypothetical protein